jgi:uncharacterized membrane protein
MGGGCYLYFIYKDNKNGISNILQMNMLNVIIGLSCLVVLGLVLIGVSACMISGQISRMEEENDRRIDDR